ncbi:MAG: hypothetical protein M1822_009885 [Bathelium mastoideum]|nr:MAG: hypothetical protein M1822_009885 [Bathelium mastoideum]
MASPTSPTHPKDPGFQTNMEVDYVINYHFADIDRTKATEEFEKLIQALASVGLATEVRNGNEQSVLIFTRVASEQHLFGEVYRSRVRDWINGVRAAAPKRETEEALREEPLYEAERLRIIYQLITNPASDGGAGITPREGEWKRVDSVFALHNHTYNKAWIKKWSTQWFLTPDDIDDIRNRLGEKVAYYFAFTQSYFAALIFPAAFGASAWLLLGNFSPIYAIVSCLWCVVFVEYWKHQEVDLAVRWGVRNVSRIEHKRKGFKYEFEATDPVTGEKVQIFPATKRLQRQLLQIPFAIAAAILLGTLIATCFGIEIFISEIYDGPLKSILVFLPTGILTTGLPVLTGILTNFATQLNNYENYETRGSYDDSLTEKEFILNFITSYLPIFLTAFVYVPFGTVIVPYLDIFSLTVRPFAQNDKQMEVPTTGFVIDPSRLTKQVIYFTVTAQIVNQGMEIVVPYLKRRGLNKYKEMQIERAAKKGGAVPNASENDEPDEAAFLARVRKEAELDHYDVTTDLREMVLQFGYLSLFSVVWPLTGLSFLVNDWLELRTDAIKICVEMQRPTPWRADTIGPWLDSLAFLTWLGSITTSALIYLFSNNGLGPDGSPHEIKAWGLLLTILFSEHLFLVVRWMTRLAISKLDSPGMQKERRERYLVRQRYFEESLNETANLPAMGDFNQAINRKNLEEDARESSLHDSTVEDRFWTRQRGWKETATVGKSFIANALGGEKDKKAQ